MIKSLLRSAYDLMAPRHHDSTLAVIYADFPDVQRRYLFANPSHTEALKTRTGLRLLGGIGEQNETHMQTLFRELREELVGHDTMGKIAQGRMVEISELQDRALGLLARKQSEMERQAASGQVWSHHYNFNPDRFNKRQENWFRSANYIYALRFTPEEFTLLENVGHETTKRDNKELANVTVTYEPDIRSDLASGRKFMGYSGEQRALELFLKVAPSFAPSLSTP